MPYETRTASQSGAVCGEPLPRITLVVAVADNGVIGRDAGLPWRLPEDLRRFKAQTLGRPVLMGRRTFASIGRALPGRHNIVLTRSTDWRVPPESGPVTVVHGWRAALQAAGEVPELMVIGGAEVYAMALPQAERVLLTRVHAEIDGDTYLPPFDPLQWVELSCERFAADARNSIPMSFVELRRRG